MPIWGIRWPLPVPFQPLSSIGIVGGGQLALMLAEAAAELGISVHIQTPGAGDPAVSRAATLVQAALDDDQATRLLADRCGATSFENEWMPLERLYPLALDFSLCAVLEDTRNLDHKPRQAERR
jgi:phosphoribosylaminoimidazole carboxylase (NCAIR synthetase)